MMWIPVQFHYTSCDDCDWTEEPGRELSELEYKQLAASHARQRNHTTQFRVVFYVNEKHKPKG